MPDAAVADRKAGRAEVLAHAEEIRNLVVDLGLSSPRVRDDGAIVVHSDEAGYRSATRLSTAASRVVGAYVHVITDDVPGAASALEL